MDVVCGSHAIMETLLAHASSTYSIDQPTRNRPCRSSCGLHVNVTITESYGFFSLDLVLHQAWKWCGRNTWSDIMGINGCKMRGGNVYHVFALQASYGVTHHSPEQGVGVFDEAGDIRVDVLPERRRVVRLGKPLDELLLHRQGGETPESRFEFEPCLNLSCPLC